MIDSERRGPFTWMAVILVMVFILEWWSIPWENPSSEKVESVKEEKPSETEAIEDVLMIQYEEERIAIQKVPDVSEKVLGYEEAIINNAEEYEVDSFSNIILALMMQESEGKGEDPMQASESYCGDVGCIENPSTSVEKGVEYFAEVMDQANDDVKLALQSYNFGNGFITYVMNHGGSYTKQLAINYSRKMYDQLKASGNYTCRTPEEERLDACFGDINYVGAVLKYFEE